MQKSHENSPGFYPKALENINYRTTGIGEMTEINRGAFFLEQWKKFS